MTDEPLRTYRTSEVVVEWRPQLCIHCQNCIQQLPSVFNLDARPWVNINGADAETIKSVVQQCPSNALKLGDIKSE